MCVRVQYSYLCHAHEHDARIMTDESGDDSNTVVIKSCLKKALAPSGDFRDAIIRKVDDIVFYISRLHRRASLILHAHLLRCFNEGLDLPDESQWKSDTWWRHFYLLDCLEQGDEEVLNTIYYLGWKCPEALPEIQTVSHCRNIVTNAAQKLKTAFKNNITVPLVPRIRRLCKLFLKYRKLEHGDADRKNLRMLFDAFSISWSGCLFAVDGDQDGTVEDVTNTQLAAAIENGSSKYELPDDCVRFVDGIRASLHLYGDTALSGKWMKQFENINKVLSFLRSMQRACELLEIKGVKICPTFKIRRHHVFIDLSTLVPILSSCGACASNVDLSVVKSLFALPRQTKKNKMFKWIGSFSTDGISSSWTYSALTANERMDKKYHRTKDDDNDENTSVKKKNLDVVIPDKDAAHVIGLDAGVKNLVYMSDGDQQWVLTGHDYYVQSGAVATKRKSDAVYKELKAKLGNVFSVDTSLRTLDMDKLFNYCRACSAYEDEWWSTAFKPVIARGRFRTFSGKMRTLDRFFSGVRKSVSERVSPAKRPVVAYGAGFNSPSGKGRLTVPTTMAYKACRRHMETYLQNEDRTSRQCYVCHADVKRCYHSVSTCYTDDGWKVDWNREKVFYEGDGELRSKKMYCRGLLFCPKCSKFLNRDYSSSRCIKMLFETTQLEGKEVPEQFKRRLKLRRKKKSVARKRKQ